MGSRCTWGPGARLWVPPPLRWGFPAACCRAYSRLLWEVAPLCLREWGAGTVPAMRKCMRVPALFTLLTNPQLGDSVSLTADDFKKLTEDDLTDVVAEGRFLIRNFSARPNCTVVTANDRMIFTKNPALHIPHRASRSTKKA
jgi:hypothetical protein